MYRTYDKFKIYLYGFTALTMNLSPNPLLSHKVFPKLVNPLTYASCCKLMLIEVAFLGTDLSLF